MKRLYSQKKKKKKKCFHVKFADSVNKNVFYTEKMQTLLCCLS